MTRYETTCAVDSNLSIADPRRLRFADFRISSEQTDGLHVQVTSSFRCDSVVLRPAQIRELRDALTKFLKTSKKGKKK